MNMKCKNIVPDKMVDKQKTRRDYRIRLVRIAAMLAVAIALFAIIQWHIGTRGWDLTAGFMTILMAILGFLFIATVIRILQGRPLAAQDIAQYGDHARFDGEDWLEELHRNDPHIIGSPSFNLRKLHED